MAREVFEYASLVLFTLNVEMEFKYKFRMYFNVFVMILD